MSTIMGLCEAEDLIRTIRAWRERSRGDYPLTDEMLLVWKRSRGLNSCAATDSDAKAARWLKEARSLLARAEVAS